MKTTFYSQLENQAAIFSSDHHYEKVKGNYNLYFRVWDRLMGTENPDYVKNYDVIQERRFGKTEVWNFSGE